MTSQPARSSMPELLAHAAWVRALARRLVGEEHAAEDVVQETWLSALRRPPRADAPLEPWLRTVLANHARRRATREARHVEPAPEDSAVSPDELLGELELQGLLAREVARLAEPYRGVVLRRYYRGESCARIARATGVPAATVRSQLRRGLALLRRRMDALFGGDSGARSRAMLALGGGSTSWIPTVSIPSALRGAWMMSATTRWMGWAAVVCVAIGAGVAMRVLSGGDVQSPEAARSASALEAPPIVPAPASAPREARLAEESARTTVAAVELVPAPATDIAATRFLVRARIVDQDGRPLAGALFKAGVQPHATSALAGDDGFVALALVEEQLARDGDGAQRAWIEVSARDHATRTASARLAPDGPTELGDFVLAPGGRIQGRVTAPDGSALAGARVLATGAVFGLSPEEAARTGPAVEAGAPITTTGAGGDYVLTGVPIGEARVWAHAPGMRHAFSAPILVQAGAETRGVDLVLAPLEEADTIAGIVLDPSGAPVARGAVWCTWSSSFDSERISAAIEDGRFQFVLTRQEPHDLCARDANGEHTPAVLRAVAPGARGLVLQLGAERRISVRVRDQDALPIVGARMSVSAEDDYALDPLEAPRSDEAGIARVRVPAERFRIEVAADGFERTTAGPFEPTNVPDEFELVLARLPGLRGRVLADGRPLAGAEVLLHATLPSGGEIVHGGFPMRMQPRPKARATTDETGYYQLSAPPAGGNHRAGGYVVIARAPGRAAAESAPLVLEPRRAAIAPDLFLDPGGAIEGRVIPPPGRAAAGLAVAISRGDGELHTQRTDEHGGFRFEALTPGPWQVAQLAREPRLSTRFGSTSAPFVIDWSCEVRSGVVTHYDIDLRDEAQAIFLGRLAFDGASAAGWVATLEHSYAAEIQPLVRPVVLDADGRFRITVPPGPHHLRLTSPAEAAYQLTLSTPVTLTAGETSWERDLATGALQLLAGATSGATSSATVLRWRSAEGLQAVLELPGAGFDALTLTSLPAGRWTIDRLTGSHEGASWQRVSELELVAGREHSVELP